MLSEYSIIINDLSKNYSFYNKPIDRLKQIIIPSIFNIFKLKPRTYSTEINAISNLNLKIKKGETIGIIGRNGSGKSTLLKMICGVLQPSMGNIKSYGKIFPILELGSSFNPENTGLQNIYLNYTIHGFNESEIKTKIDKVIDFADIGSFINMPVKTYSTGMIVRLAFAIAINIEPDILIIDEALAVGDEAFQLKCYSKIRKLQKRGITIVLVSHSSQNILQLCNKAFVLDQGKMIIQGNPKYVIDNYLKFLNEKQNINNYGETTLISNKSNKKENKSLTHFDPNITKPSSTEYPSKGLLISNLSLTDDKDEIVNILVQGRRYNIHFQVNVNVKAYDLAFGTTIKNVTGLHLTGATTEQTKDKWISEVNKGQIISVKISFKCNLNAATYFINVGVVGLTENNSNRQFLHRFVDKSSFKIISNINNLESDIVMSDPSMDIFIKE